MPEQSIVTRRFVTRRLIARFSSVPESVAHHLLLFFNEHSSSKSFCAEKNCAEFSLVFFRLILTS